METRFQVKNIPGSDCVLTFDPGPLNSGHRLMVVKCAKAVCRSVVELPVSPSGLTTAALEFCRCFFTSSLPSFSADRPGKEDPESVHHISYWSHKVKCAKTGVQVAEC